MRRKANVLKKAAALLAVIVGGVVFCCSRRPDGVVSDRLDGPVQIEDVSLDQKPDRMVMSDEKVASDLKTALDEKPMSDGMTVPDRDAYPAAEIATEPGIWVYVCGAVRSPGVYYVSSDARVFEAVDLAGGFLPDAREDAVNLAETMSDGERIFVPDGSMEAGVAAEPAEFPGSPGKVNINRADVSELMTLPGIGESKAQAIVSYRQEHPFQSIEEIMNVSGIKEGAFEKIRDLITT